MHVHACMYYLCSYSCGVFVISAAAKQVHNKPAVELCDVKVKVSSVEDTCDISDCDIDMPIQFICQQDVICSVCVVIVLLCDIISVLFIAFCRCSVCAQETLSEPGW